MRLILACSHGPLERGPRIRASINAPCALFDDGHQRMSIPWLDEIYLKDLVSCFNHFDDVTVMTALCGDEYNGEGSVFFVLACL